MLHPVETHSWQNITINKSVCFELCPCGICVNKTETNQSFECVIQALGLVLQPQQMGMSIASPATLDKWNVKKSSEGVDGSVGLVSDWKARHNTDVGLRSQCSNGFFS